MHVSGIGFRRWRGEAFPGVELVEVIATCCWDADVVIFYCWVSG